MSDTKGQLFASPGVIIRKSVVLKHPGYGLAKSSSDAKNVVVIDSQLSSVSNDTPYQQSATDVICHPNSSEVTLDEGTAALIEFSR